MYKIIVNWGIGRMMEGDMEQGRKQLQVENKLIVLPLSIRVSNGSGQPTSGPDLGHKNRLVPFQTLPKTQPVGSWWANPGLVTVNQRVLLGWAGHVGSNLRFCVLGTTFMVPFRYASVNRKIYTLVMHSLFLTYWPP